jgi:hypothetical protein
MRLSTNLALPLSVALFGLLLVPQPALAVTKDCPIEPAQNVSIASGDSFSGANCTLSAVGDVDSFVFKANTGDVWQLAAAMNGGGPNICVTLYNPGLVQIFNQCSDRLVGDKSVVTSQTLTAAGAYAIVLTEASGGTLNYALSLERLYPFPPDAQPVEKLKQVIKGEVSPLSAMDPFTFEGATTGTYRATATIRSRSHHDLCMNAYFPDGTNAGSGCTDFPVGGDTIMLDFTPPQDGTLMLLLAEAGYDATVSYTLDVSCYLGHCPPLTPPPTCALTDTLSYAAGTLNMDFTVENTYPTTWNIWLTEQNSMQLLYSKPQQVTDSPTAVPMTTSLAPEGKVGVLSTLTTPSKGIVCASWVQIETGTP